MAAHYLVTGGAGFIGRHVTAALLESGHSVRILDCMLEQVHGADAKPDPMIAGSELVVGDIRDPDAVAAALRGCDRVIHLAAEVGVGQSMYAIDRYTHTNEYGTSVLLQALADAPVERIVTASSMSIYGEGLYRDGDGAFVENARRPLKRDPASPWDPADPLGRPLKAVPTPEWKRPSLSSVYALNKYAQERMTLIVGEAYGMDAVALRLFNVYGPGQALSNPYTGVLAIFASRILNGEPPVVFEDGLQRRDFVHVKDVARAICAAADHDGLGGETMNIASGVDRTIVSIAEDAVAALGRPDLVAEVTGKTRSGDIRHCFADTTRARERLGFRPVVAFSEGLAELAEWVALQTANDRVPQMRRELELRGLVS